MYGERFSKNSQTYFGFQDDWSLKHFFYRSFWKTDLTLGKISFHLSSLFRGTWPNYSLRSIRRKSSFISRFTYQLFEGWKSNDVAKWENIENTLLGVWSRPFLSVFFFSLPSGVARCRRPEIELRRQEWPFPFLPSDIITVSRNKIFRFVVLKNDFYCDGR